MKTIKFPCIIDSLRIARIRVKIKNYIIRKDFSFKNYQKVLIRNSLINFHILLVY